MQSDSMTNVRLLAIVIAMPPIANVTPMAVMFVIKTIDIIHISQMHRIGIQTY